MFSTEWFIYSMHPTETHQEDDFNYFDPFFTEMLNIRFPPFDQFCKVHNSWINAVKILSVNGMFDPWIQAISTKSIEKFTKEEFKNFIFTNPDEPTLYLATLGDALDGLAFECRALDHDCDFRSYVGQSVAMEQMGF